MDIQIILGLLFVMTLLVALANKLSVPYPILLVLVGLGVSFVPGLPEIVLRPEIVFVLFLPPIIQYAAYGTSARDFRANLRSIGLLAIGLVITTTIVVALVAHTIIPGMPWGAAFAFGAIVAPTDSIAATSIAQRLGLPRRIVTVLEGESLLNDATSIVVYKVAVAAVASGVFSLANAGLQFVISSVGGVAIGIGVVLLLTPLFQRLREDIPVYLILTFLSGFGAYLLADALHVSGVLAVAALGIMYGQPRFNTMTADLRIQGAAIWEIVVFVLNGLIFILVGLQLRGIVKQLSDGSLTSMIWYACILCFTVIVTRFIWVFPGTYIPRLPAKVRARDPFPAWQHIVIVSWSGMRGGISLATALALPEGFPQRNNIIFLTFSVILATLVLQGLSLPWLIRTLKVVDDGNADREENKARLKAAQAAQMRLQSLAQENAVSPVLAEKLSRQYTSRVRRYAARYDGEPDGEMEDHFSQFSQLEEDLLETELKALIQLRNDGVINDEVLRRVQRDLDFELLRLRGN